MIERDPEPGDIIVFEKTQIFPTAGIRESEGVVEEVAATRVNCGSAGWVSIDDIVSIKDINQREAGETDDWSHTVSG